MKLDREVIRQSMRLYLVTDRTWLGEESLEVQVEQAIRAGVTCVQLREKHLDTEAFIVEGQKMKAITEKYGIPLIINDNVEVAIACDADGVHIGQSDGDVRVVRERIGPDKIIGVSTRTLEQAQLAQAQGADYVGVGAVFETSTKLDAKALPIQVLRQIADGITIPVVAIGGISEDNVLQLTDSHTDGIAVISAILAKEDKAAAIKKLLQLVEQVVS